MKRKFFEIIFRDIAYFIGYIGGGAIFISFCLWLTYLVGKEAERHWSPDHFKQNELVWNREFGYASNGWWRYDVVMDRLCGGVLIVFPSGVIFGGVCAWLSEAYKEAKKGP
jgi:hypothetical protein